MSTIIGGSSPSITFSDSTTQASAGLTAASPTIASGVLTFPDATTQSSGSGVAKAWVRFSVSGSTVTINKNYNISSITRSAAGAYTFNFTNSLTDANYSVVGNSSVSTSSTTVIPSVFGQAASPYYSVPTSSSFTFYYYNFSSAGIDPTYGTVAVFD